MPLCISYTPIHLHTYTSSAVYYSLNPILMPNPLQDPNEELKKLGEHLALLLASTNLPDDVKDAWATLVPEMSVEQMGRLGKILVGHLSSATQVEFANLAKQLEEAKETHARKVAEAEATAQKELDEIEAMLTDK